MIRRREGGFALLLVLWTVALLAVLGTQLTASGRSEALLARNIRAAAVTQAAADGAVFTAVFHALDSSPAHWPPDGALHRLSGPGTVTEVRIANEAGKVNPNGAPAELLAALMHRLGADTRTATAVSLAILDWRFADAQRVGGAKTETYRAADRSYGPPSAPFQTLEELGLVLGMTPELLRLLLPHLTLFHEGPPNPAVADPMVRDAMRDAGGGAPEPDAGAVEENVVAIEARAAGPDGSGFVRRAVVRLGQRANGSLYQVLTWDAGAL